MTTTTVLTLISGVAWTLVYIDAIRIGLKDRTYAMPLFALALNFAWEGLYTYRSLASGPDLQGIINACWFLFDIGLVYTFVRFGRRYWPPSLPPWTFYAWGALALATAVLLQLAFFGQFGEQLASRYSAFLQNLLMSVLFIGMFVARSGPEGQSRFIAVNKWIGTLAPTFVYGVFEQNLLVIVAGALCSVFDLIYIGLLVWARKHKLN
jgi:hypothetical protein